VVAEEVEEVDGMRTRSYIFYATIPMITFSLLANGRVILPQIVSRRTRWRVIITHAVGLALMMHPLSVA